MRIDINNEITMEMKNRVTNLIIVLACSLGVGQMLYAQPTNWQSRGIGGGGALFANSISPHNPDDAYILTDMGGVYHTTDFGLSWQMINFQELTAHITTGIRYTSDPQTVYAIKPYPNRLVKSTDGGLTFEQLSNVPTGNPYFFFADDQSTTNVVTSGYDGDVFYSNDSGNTWKSIYKKNNTGGDQGYYIAGAFWDVSGIYICMGTGLLVSTNNGSSFTFEPFTEHGIPAGQYASTYAAASQNGTIRLFITMTKEIMPGHLWAGGEMGVYRIDYNKDTNWTKVGGNPVTGTHVGNKVSMARNNIETVYLGSGDTNHGWLSVLKSTNGGNSWANIFLAENNQNIYTGWMGRRGDIEYWWSDYPLCLAVCPTDANRVFIGDMGFTHGTKDGGNTWHQMYVQASDENAAGILTPKRKTYHSIGLEQTSSWNMCWSDSSNILIGYADFTAIRSTDGGESFSKNYYNLPYNSVNHILRGSDGKLYASCSSIHDLYTTNRPSDYDGKGGEIKYSADHGLTWSTLRNFGNNPVLMTAIDPNNSNTMYATVHSFSNGGIYVTHNLQDGSGSNWSYLAKPPRTEGHPNTIQVLNDGTLVCTYSVRRTDRFTASSGVFYSTDGGNSWMDRTDARMQYWTWDLVVDPHDVNQNTWYAGVRNGWGGYGNDLQGLYKSTNRGLSWTRIINNMNVYSCTFSPNDPDVIYVGSHGNGLVYSSNINDQIPVFSTVEGFPFSNPNRIYFNPYKSNEIWVTSFGGGTWVGNTDPATGLSSNVYSKFKLSQNFPNPFKSSTTINYQLEHSCDVILKVYDLQGKEIITLVNGRRPAGNHQVEFKSNALSNGMYLYKITANGTTQTKKMIRMQ